ncbi:MAG: hypothetical protein DRQ41_02015 [Gammaproteobacteria bacterium]|nr:MAG: hypothetical protein DRQ41_02015 [Gammaproteobacteria bacterium]
MCRYAFVNYKQTYACFSCRKVFKKVTFDDYIEQQGKKTIVLSGCKKKSEHDRLEKHYNTTMDEIISEYNESINKCPDCCGLMANVGMDFKAPRRNDTKNWKILEGMYHIGVIFQTCGCEGFGYVPRTKADYIEYLRNRLREYQGYYKNIEFNTSFSVFQRREEANRWLNKIQKVKLELKNQ